VIDINVQIKKDMDMHYIDDKEFKNFKIKRLLKESKDNKNV